MGFGGGPEGGGGGGPSYMAPASFVDPCSPELDGSLRPCWTYTPGGGCAGPDLVGVGPYRGGEVGADFVGMEPYLGGDVGPAFVGVEPYWGGDVGEGVGDCGAGEDVFGTFNANA